MDENDRGLLDELELTLQYGRLMATMLHSELLAYLLGVALQELQDMKTSIPNTEHPAYN